ncbi:ISNCY family transposase, partial [Algimonas arctica]|uniref:ISNCY family transposase n=1 Tax=Algimonas arctica TaxID=1479486 RepID=UPI001676050A
SDFGPQYASEMLGERHDIIVSRETLRQWMIQSGLWKDRKTRRKIHQMRSRRDCYGELIQIDGSHHDWFEGRGPKCCLLVFIDDATSALQELRFVESESTFSYMRALETYLERHGRPVAFYSDKHTVFRTAKPNPAANGMTQFGRALAELNIDIICANTPQGKGRVERANRTLQDRLIKEMRLENISNMDAANRYAARYIAKHNERFAVTPRQAVDVHRPVEIAVAALAKILCVRDERYVGQNLSLNFQRVKYMLERSPENNAIIGKKIDIHVYADGIVELAFEGRNLPYTVYDQRPRINSGAVTENKRLGSVLAWIKEQQTLDEPDPGTVRTIKANSSVRNNGYVSTGKHGGCRPKLKDGTLLPPTSYGVGVKSTHSTPENT